MVDVTGDLLRPTAGSDVLSAVQRRPAFGGREAQQVRRDQRDGTPRAFLPRRVGRRVDDHLAHDAPAGVVGLAAGHQEAGERLREHLRVGLGAVGVKMTQRLADAAAVSDRACKLARVAPG